MDAKEILKGNIDDNVLNDNKTWSSNKISENINKIDGDISEVNKNINNLNENINNKMDKEEKVVINIEAAKWQENIYSFEDIYPESQYNILLKKSFNSTEEQNLAWMKAELDEDDDLNRLRANGEVPKVDIPIVLILHKK